MRLAPKVKQFHVTAHGTIIAITPLDKEGGRVNTPKTQEKKGDEDMCGENGGGGVWNVSEGKGLLKCAPVGRV